MYIIVLSHRARERVLQHLNDPNRQSYWTLKRATTDRGIFPVTQDEIDNLRTTKIKGWRVLSPPYDDLRPCVSFKTCYDE